MELFGQIRFWEKNLIDLDMDGITITSNDPGSIDNGTPYVNFLRNRNNVGIWSSTGGSGAASITVSLNGLTSIESIMLVDNNFATYNLSYEEAGTGIERALISITGNIKDAPIHEFAKFQATKFYIRNITQRSGSSKRMAQLILTRKIVAGDLPGHPLIKNLMLNRTKKFSRMISGKLKQVDSAGNFEAKVLCQFLNDKTSIIALQRVFKLQEGVLCHMNPNSINDFWNNIEGYRPIDFYLVTPKNDFDPSPLKKEPSGLELLLDLVEVV